MGGGRIQWYAFLNIPPGSLSVPREETLAWLKRDEFALFRRILPSYCAHMGRHARATLLHGGVSRQ